MVMIGTELEFSRFRASDSGSIVCVLLTALPAIPPCWSRRTPKTIALAFRPSR